MDFEDFAGYKYVRLPNNEFRFEKLTAFCRNHCELVKENELAISAGIIGLTDKTIKMISGYSMSLNIGFLPDDMSLLEAITNRKEQT